MCRIAAEEGIEAIVATPHVLRGRWRTPPIIEIESRLETLRAKTNDTPRLLAGSEYFFAHDMPEVLSARNAIVPLAKGRYVLLELAANIVPPMFDQPLYRAQLEGWIPVLAHPERNTVFQSRPELLASLVRSGLRTQITAGSLTGEFGTAARRSAETLLERRLVHFVATDAHNTNKRAPRIAAALGALRDLVGENVAEALTVRNPRAVIENRALEYDPEPLEPANRGFLTRVKAFLKRE